MRGAAEGDLLRRVVEAIRSWDPRARVILFGSRARGDHLLNSDYDLIVVSSRFQGIPFPRRAAAILKELYRRGVHGDFELLCYTPEELERKAREIGVVSVALREGIEIEED